jgi:hypothetical protein
MREGVMYVETLRGMGWANMMDRGASRELVEVVQNCMPIRIRSILVVEAGWFFRAALAFAKMVLKSKLVQRVEAVPLEELRERVDPSQLLAEFGGELRVSYEELARRFEAEDDNLGLIVTGGPDEQAAEGEAAAAAAAGAAEPALEPNEVLVAEEEKDWVEYADPSAAAAAPAVATATAAAAAAQ